LTWSPAPQSQDELPPSLAAAYTAPGEGASFLFECAAPGAAVVMDYRCWHRGLGNCSGLVRPLLYARYVAQRGPPPPPPVPRAGQADQVREAKRRIAPVAVPPQTKQPRTDAA